MASITGFITPNTVQENSSGSPITVPNVQKDDFIVAIASAGGTSLRPNIAIEGLLGEVIADVTSSPVYTEYKKRCVTSRTIVWGGYGVNGIAYNPASVPTTDCSVETIKNEAMTRVVWLRADEAGTVKVSGSLDKGSLANFRVYHFRAQTQAGAGKVVEKVSWVIRPPLAQGSGSTWRQRANTNDIILIVASGKNGGTISATPSGSSVVNLLNYQFQHGQYVRTLVRLDWVTSSSDITYTYTNADFSQFLAGYSVDLRERYVDFPEEAGSGTVYWVVVPVRVLSNFQRIYPKPLEQLLSTASAVDPTKFGLEANFTRGNIKYMEDPSGQVAVKEYEELHIYRIPSTVQISPTVGDILVNDNELEAFLTALKKGWVS